MRNHESNEMKKMLPLSIINRGVVRLQRTENLCVYDNVRGVEKKVKSKVKQT